MIKLFGFCSHPQQSVLVYEFLEGGSMKDLLSNKEEVVSFDWIKRANVVRGVADALSYMHHNCSPPIVHRDISRRTSCWIQNMRHISLILAQLGF